MNRLNLVLDHNPSKLRTSLGAIKPKLRTSFGAIKPKKLELEGLDLSSYSILNKKNLTHPIFSGFLAPKLVLNDYLFRIIISPDYII
jgi:hypothetical protein